MAEGILNALNNPEERSKKVSSALRLYEEQYSRDVYKSKLKKLLETL